MGDTPPTSQADLLQALFGDAPAMAPPPGVTPNFKNPPNKNAAVIATTVTCLTVITFFVSVRVFVKLRVNKLGFRLEDWFCIIGAICFLTFAIITFVEIGYGAGRHQWDVTVRNAQEFTKLAVALESTYCWAICFAKLSLVVTYLKLFANKRFTPVWYSCWAIILSNTCLYIASFIATVMACIPIEKLWNPQLEGRCIDYSALVIATSALNMGSDIATLVLPLVCVWRLQMSAKRKRGVSMILATGLFCVLCSLLRFISAFKYAASKDQIWFLVDQGLWSEGEVTSALMASCMLSIPQFFQVVFPRLARVFGTVGATIETSRNSRHAKIHSHPQHWSSHGDGPASPATVHKKHAFHEASYALENTKDSASENEANSPLDHEWA